MQKNLLGLTMLAIAGFSIAAPLTAFAQSNPASNPTPSYTALEPLPCVPGGNCTPGSLVTEFEFQNYVQYVFNLAIFLSAAAAVFMIVWGGFEYMTTDSWQGKSDGLKKAKNAVIGLLLVLTSYLILRTIDPRLVAIPTTLVKPLDIPYQSKYSQEFLDSLQGQVNRLAAVNKEINDANNDVMNKNNSIDAQKKALIEKMCAYSSCTTDTVKDFCQQNSDNANCLELARLTDQQSVNAGGLVTKVALINIREAGSANPYCQNLVSQDKLKNCLSAVDDQAKIYTKNLVKLGQMSQSVNDAAAYEKAVINLDYITNTSLAAGNPNTAITFKKLDEAFNLVSIEDAAIRAKLNAQLQAAKDKIKPPKNTN